MSVVDDLLRRHGLSWRLQPCRIVLDNYPQLVVQSGPSFDLRDKALKGARERALAATRKRRQRARAIAPDVTPTAQYNEPIGVCAARLGAENLSVNRDAYGL